MVISPKIFKAPLFGLALVSALALQTEAKEYEIDPTHSEILFKVKHMGISTVTGRFDTFSGRFDVDPKNLGATKGSATIEVGTVNTNNAKRDGHLKNDDFFNAEKYPKIQFVSKSVRNVNMADTTCELVGDLTIRDVTKEVVLKVKGEGIINDPWGNERAAFRAVGSINRLDYGLKWNMLMEAGGYVVGPVVNIELSFEGTHKLPAPATPAGKTEGKKK
jgi:polyisoprenoid-binding protein YceI